MLSDRRNQLTDTQILTLVIGITFPVLGIIGAIVAVLYSNKRIDDLRTDFTKRFDDLEKSLKAHIDNAFEHMKMLLELHEAKHHKD